MPHATILLLDRFGQVREETGREQVDWGPAVRGYEQNGSEAGRAGLQQAPWRRNIPPGHRNPGTVVKYIALQYQQSQLP